MWTGIELLYPLQEMRIANPWMEDFFLSMSSRAIYLILPIMLAFAFYWCIDKKQGEIIGVGCVSAMVFSMLIKFGIAIERPWVLDKNIIHVPGAHDNGLSCPSGHAAITTSAFGAVALLSRKWIVATAMVTLIALVVTARLVLCVHTPLDMIVGVIIGLVSLVVAWKAMDYSYGSDRAFHLVSAGYLVFFTALFLLSIFAWNADTSEISDFAGFFYGAMIGRELEHRYVGYQVPDVGFIPKLKIYLVGVLVGAAILGAFMVLIPFGTLIGGFILMIWAFFLYPGLIVRSSKMTT